MYNENWMKTNFHFGDSYAIFEVSHRQLECAKIRDIVSNNQNDIARLEQELLRLIHFFRPELKGGQLIQISFTGGLSWRIIYTHPSLPKVDCASLPEPIPLIPLEVYQEPMPDILR